MRPKALGATRAPSSMAGAALGFPHIAPRKRDACSELLHALKTLSGTVCDTRHGGKDPPGCYHRRRGPGSAIGCSAPEPSCLFPKDLTLSRPFP